MARGKTEMRQKNDIAPATIAQLSREMWRDRREQNQIASPAMWTRGRASPVVCVAAK